jgi:hypothetical protein
MKRRVFKLVKDYYDATGGDETIAKIFNKIFNDTTSPIVKNASVSVNSINSFDVTVTNFIENILPIIINSDNPESLFSKSIDDFLDEAEAILVKLTGNNPNVNNIFNNDSNENILKLKFNMILARAEDIENKATIISAIDAYYIDPRIDWDNLLAETFNNSSFTSVNEISIMVGVLIDNIRGLTDIYNS